MSVCLLNEMTILGQGSVMLGLFQMLLFFVSLFLILLVLVQRGKGGGLTGALGGMGGQSAFGTKAGDAFTKITIITTIIWITLCMVTISGFNPPPAAKITKKMTLMEKARALTQPSSIGGVSEEISIPDDLSAAGEEADAEGESVDADSIQDTGDNVAQRQTPENTPAETGDAEAAAATDEAAAATDEAAAATDEASATQKTAE